MGSEDQQKRICRTTARSLQWKHVSCTNSRAWSDIRFWNTGSPISLVKKQVRESGRTNFLLRKSTGSPKSGKSIPQWQPSWWHSGPMCHHVLLASSCFHHPSVSLTHNPSKPGTSGTANAHKCPLPHPSSFLVPDKPAFSAPFGLVLRVRASYRCSRPRLWVLWTTLTLVDCSSRPYPKVINLNDTKDNLENLTKNVCEL